MNIKFQAANLVLISLGLTCVVSAQNLIPAGSLVKCRVSEKISHKVTDIGDPVACNVNNSQFPYGTTVIGSFQEYKDPGHFVGKGWMVVRFDRIVLPYGAGGAIVPVQTKVVDVPQFFVDKQGRIRARWEGELNYNNSGEYKQVEQAIEELRRQ